MNWRRIWPVTRAATERASRADWVRGREIMMAALYFPGRSEQPETRPTYLDICPLTCLCASGPLQGAAVLSLLIHRYADATSH